MFPWEALAGWLAVAILAGSLARRFRRWNLVWCGLGVTIAGVIYYPSVMAHRPQHYYALLEFLASSFAFGAGVVIAFVGVLRLRSSGSHHPGVNADNERDRPAGGNG
jgi:hypothetical protein